MPNFVHLHVHSHYSMLDGMSKIPDLVDKCRKYGMNAIALTDHGNMFGIKELTDYVAKVNGASKKKLKDIQKSFDDEQNEEKKADLQKQIDELKEKIATELPFKPIIGTEAYCARRTLFDKDKEIKAVDPETGRESRLDASGWHLILLAKNKQGYKNLCKMASQAYVDGFYQKPRIDKNLLEKYHEGIIVCSACLGGEIPQLIIANKLDEAEKSVRWFKNLFGDDYYIELQRHQTDKPNASTDVYERQKLVNPHLVELAKKCGVKIIATNDVHFVEEDHGEAHDRLVCLSTGRDFDDPDRMHYTKQEWLKTPDEMAEIFPDYPEALENTLEIADKVEVYSIESGPIMPKFDIPEEFGTEEGYRQRFTDEDLFNEFTRNEKGEVVMSREDAEAKIKKIGGYEKIYRIKLEADYLSKLAWEGAQERYGAKLTWNAETNLYDVELDQKTKDQIIFELHIMKTMGFPGYFLIVQDYIRAAREILDVWVGPGRGSAAGSVVAYCLKITNIDPLKYDLLFERFLNPDRISLPDIDVDFEDSGRGKVLDWVTEKYGKEKVAHIITYGTMATKSSIADVARVQKVPLPIVNQLKELIPDSFEDYKDPDDLEGRTFGQKKGVKPPKVKLKNCFKYVPELKEARFGNDVNISSMLKYAEQLEDTNRQVGIHACGVIIGADDLTKFAPLCTVKDRASNEDVLVTQYDGHVIESVGLIKMDFLGLSTLTLQKETIKNIKHTTGQDIDIEGIPIDDELTYKLFSEGRTIGVFQFESPGMQKYLRELKPTVITDLIAMNALYRPGPIAYIPNFIDRKHGREEIKYDLPIMQKYLGDTYGITVYQEQVMLLSRLLAGFTRGQSDALRKAMGKKIFAMLAELKPKFIEGSLKNPNIREGLDRPMSDEELTKTLEKIWKDWEAFASYAFNKSHAACYAWVAYQTGYLKAHYPAEYMAAILTLSKDNISDVTKFMEECRSMKIDVKSPNVNESELNFAVNQKGEILYGLGGVKGVGENAVDAIVKERNEHGLYKNMFDFVERVNLTACNKKAIESLAFAGAFDCFDTHYREQYFTLVENPTKRIEEWCFNDTIIRYGTRFQADKDFAQNSLFGNDNAVEITKPTLPTNEKWSSIFRLNKEKEVIGIYLSSHPLDDYFIEIKSLCNTTTTELTRYLQTTDREEKQKLIGKEIRLGGIVASCREAMSKKGNKYGVLIIEDFYNRYEIPLFGNDYLNFGKFLREDIYVMASGSLQDKNSRYGNSRTVVPTDNVELEFRLKNITLLDDLIKNDVQKTLRISILLSNIDIDFVTELEDVLQSKEDGNDVNLEIDVIENGKPLRLKSNEKKIKLNSSFRKFLKKNISLNKFDFKVF